MDELLKNRNRLYFILGILVVFIFTLSIAYAAMSTVLEIHGNSEVVASNWDIHLENPEVKSGSVSANEPKISGTSTLSFDVDLNIPGEFYEFSVDVVNGGSIDAMIDSVVKTPELTTEQAKYIKYEITYENGESISTKQTLKKGTSTPIKVRVEYRKDLVASDLPSSATELSLKLTLVYVQSDGSGSNIPNNGAQLVNVVSGNGENTGDEVCIGEECFYVLSSDDSSVTLFAKYNLYVGYSIESFDFNTGSPEMRNLVSTGIQDSRARGYISDNSFPWIGTVNFSDNDYWHNYSNELINVYDERSSIYNYVNNYKIYLEGLGIIVNEARVPNIDDFYNMGCISSKEEYSYDSCSNKYEWNDSTAYWTGISFGDSILITRYSTAFHYSIPYAVGVRPVIVIPITYI